MRLSVGGDPVVVTGVEIDAVSVAPRVAINSSRVATAFAALRGLRLEKKDSSWVEAGIAADQSGDNRCVVLHLIVAGHRAGQAAVFELKIFHGCRELRHIIARLSFFTGIQSSLDGGKCQTSQYGDDGDNDEEFDQRKRGALTQRGAGGMVHGVRVEEVAGDGWVHDCQDGT